MFFYLSETVLNFLTHENTASYKLNTMNNVLQILCSCLIKMLPQHPWRQGTCKTCFLCSWLHTPARTPVSGTPWDRKDPKHSRIAEAWSSPGHLLTQSTPCAGHRTGSIPWWVCCHFGQCFTSCTYNRWEFLFWVGLFCKMQKCHIIVGLTLPEQQIVHPHAARQICLSDQPSSTAGEWLSTPLYHYH